MKMINRVQIWLLLALLWVVFSTSGCKKNNDDTSPESDTVTDIEGNVYKTVKIGSQWWMAENLKTTKYNDGTDIPQVKEYESWRYLASPGFCWFENDPDTYKNKYGALYNWYAVNTGKLAPKGWHVPTDTEWNTLINYLGGWQVAGGKMKSTGTIEAGTGVWYAPNAGATNESGFSAVPTGGREEGGGFIQQLPYEADWWSSTEADINNALDCLIRYDHTTAGCEPDGLDKSCGLSIRCVKD